MAAQIVRHGDRFAGVGVDRRIGDVARKTQHAVLIMSLDRELVTAAADMVEPYGDIEPVVGMQRDMKIHRTPDHRHAEVGAQIESRPVFAGDMLEPNLGRLQHVIEKLPKTGGKEFKDAFDNLTRDKVNIPQTEKEIRKIQKLREELNLGVTKLGLKGAVGKFLEAAVEGNAPISDLNKPEIKELLDNYDLWDSFRVQL